MKKVLILGRNPATFTDLKNRLTDDETQVDVAAYTDLAFLIDGAQGQITVHSTATPLNAYQKILILSTSEGHARNYIFSALACYCRKYGIQLFDDSFTNTDGKLYAMWRFWEQGVNIPKTAFGPVDFLGESLEKFGGTAVLKSVKGTKGKDNYLVHSAAEIGEIVNQNPDTDFILQNFIPNDGDYRIVLTNFQPQLAIYRSSSSDDFRNNTSLGGQATLIPLSEMDPSIINLAISAAKALDIKIAGADILTDKDTGEHSVLEVNRTPQLATGAMVEEKAEVLKHFISES